MSENKFEKAVQLEMQGFKIKPSEEVWPKIEERIREKKKRRLFFILFFFGGLALLGYWQRHLLFNENKIPESEPGITANDQEIKTNPVKSHTTDYSNKQSSVKESREDNQPTFSNAEKITASEKKKLITSVSKREKTENRDIFSPVTMQEKNKSPIIQVIVKAEEPEKNRIFTDSSLNAIDAEEKMIVGKNISDSSADKIAVKVVDPVILSKVESDLIQKNEKAADLIMENKLPRDSFEKNEPATDSLAAPEKPLLKSEKWRWGMHFTPGISSVNENPFSFSVAKSAEYLTYPGNATGGGGVILPARPSESRSGFSFQSGGFIKRDISARSNFSIGLQYAYYSEHINVGSRRDSILRYNPQVPGLLDANYVYGAATATKKFTNRYHFIELPFILQLQLNKKAFNPFFWNVGIKAGQLVSAKALVYDTAFGGIYYESKKRLNRTQFSLTTGFAWSFFNKGKIKWTIGPGVDIHLSQLVNNPLDRNKYLLFAGVRTAFSFPGKK
jgi:hypothetical protein